MTKIQTLVVSAALAIGMAPPASAGVNDPEVIIYRFPGVFDDGNTGQVGAATAFHCTNFSGVLENVRIVTRGSGGALLKNFLFGLDHLGTQGATTHPVSSYVALNMGTGFI